jgi:hypothetical protein
MAGSDPLKCDDGAQEDRPEKPRVPQSNAQGSTAVARRSGTRKDD